MRRGRRDRKPFPKLGRVARLGPPPPTPPPAHLSDHLFLPAPPLSHYLPTLPHAWHWVRVPGFNPVSLRWIWGATAGAGELRSFLPSPYGPISCSQLGSRPRPRPINAPGSAQLGGGERRGGPRRRPLFLRVPPKTPCSPRPAGTRRRGAGCAPSKGVTSRGGSLPAGSPSLNSLRPSLRRDPDPAATAAAARSHPDPALAPPRRGRRGRTRGRAGRDRVLGGACGKWGEVQRSRARPPTINFAFVLSIGLLLCTERFRGRILEQSLNPSSTVSWPCNFGRVLNFSGPQFSLSSSG